MSEDLSLDLDLSSDKDSDDLIGEIYQNILNSNKKDSSPFFEKDKSYSNSKEDRENFLDKEIEKNNTPIKISTNQKNNKEESMNSSIFVKKEEIDWLSPRKILFNQSPEEMEEIQFENSPSKKRKSFDEKEENRKKIKNSKENQGENDFGEKGANGDSMKTKKKKGEEIFFDEEKYIQKLTNLHNHSFKKIDDNSTEQIERKIKPEEDQNEEKINLSYLEDLLNQVENEEDEVDEENVENEEEEAGEENVENEEEEADEENVENEEEKRLKELEKHKTEEEERKTKQKEDEKRKREKEKNLQSNKKQNTKKLKNEETKVEKEIERFLKEVEGEEEEGDEKEIKKPRFFENRDVLKRGKLKIIESPKNGFNSPKKKPNSLISLNKQEKWTEERVKRLYHLVFEDQQENQIAKEEKKLQNLKSKKKMKEDWEDQEEAEEEEMEEEMEEKKTKNEKIILTQKKSPKKSPLFFNNNKLLFPSFFKNICESEKVFERFKNRFEDPQLTKKNSMSISLFYKHNLTNFRLKLPNKSNLERPLLFQLVLGEKKNHKIYLYIFFKYTIK